MATRAISPWRLGVVLWCVGFIIMTLYWLNSEYTRQHALFRQRASAYAQTVSQRMEQNESVMLSLELLMRTQSQLGMQDVQRFTQQLMQRYPHIYSIQFFEEVSREQAPAFVQRMKQRGLFDFQLKEPATDQPQGWRPVRPRSLYHPIVMIEPQQDGQNSQLGMDINADGQHSETLRAAEQFGHMESTAPFALPDNGRGYLLVKSVQQHGTRGGEPRQAFVGILLRHDRLLADIPLANSHAHDISVVFYPRVDRAFDNMFFRAPMTPAPAWESTWLPRFHFEQPVSSTAQPFLIKLDYQLRGGDLNLQPLVYLGLTLGMAVGFAMVMLSQRRRSRQQGMEANESLQREREMAAMTLQHIHDGVIRIDSAGRIDYLNPMAATLLQTPPEQVIGQSVFAVFRLHFEMSQHMQDNPVNESLKFRRPVELPENTSLLRKDGQSLLIEGKISPLPSRQHLHAGALITFRYLGSAHNKIRDRLTTSQKRLREHEEKLAHVARLNTMGEMASGIAHELNQPLSAIVSYNQACLRMLDDDYPDLELIRSAMHSTANQAHRAGEIITRLRAFVSKQPARREAISLNQIVRNTLMLAEHALREHGIEILLNLKEDLPPVEGDSIQIEQVTLNLLTNAIDALRHKPQPRQIRLETGATAELACLKVVDNGPGIPDTMLSKLFTPFSTTKPHGMGLGLTICQSIIESHQGHISGRNQPEGGGSFRITLPLQNAQPSSAALCEKEPLSHDANAQL